MKIPYTKEALIDYLIQAEIIGRNYWEKGVTYTLKRKGTVFPITADTDVDVILELKKLQGKFNY